MTTSSAKTAVQSLVASLRVAQVRKEQREKAVEDALRKA